MNKQPTSMPQNWYSIVAEDVENSLPLRQTARPAHIARLEKLVADNRLLTAGPNPIETGGTPGFSGSIIIAAFDSFESAQKWANDDPYIAAGVYKNVSIKPFKKVLP